MKNNKTVGYKIQTIRENKNMSRKEVAEQAGLSEEQVTRIEEDIDLPALAPLLKIARAMGVRLGTCKRKKVLVSLQILRMHPDTWNIILCQNRNRTATWSLFL